MARFALPQARYAQQSGRERVGRTVMAPVRPPARSHGAASAPGDLLGGNPGSGRLLTRSSAWSASLPIPASVQT